VVPNKNLPTLAPKPNDKMKTQWRVVKALASGHPPIDIDIGKNIFVIINSNVELMRHPMITSPIAIPIMTTFCSYVYA